ncbi:RNA-protein complex protein Nop10 [Sulfolobus acidocaldarius]|uniref:Ribosome biogenesis protein Nop10 n=2 Tax=Sulfolobus acidocaldarius TaxID=2285 RepID=M1ICR2_9CREN|nr:RNA-protein complex protein Nop10 [Sulfolobus acidocaldarius]AGE71208.1 H/ACA RNA-protein complex component Nop10p [Sulfolobus acidocaldarius N8]AGE73478.1 H/ACA RNA-protein complex component Nop10p [Sulfolobus acidocaldarius Ron12/I]WCM35137.1 RNA-protein complex protein Nop10 [Sulfolobus acidocaldarius DSM 639]
MKSKIRRCNKDYTYTMSERCPTCGEKTFIPIPPRFSPVDKYVKYRIELKKGVKLSC